MSYFLRSRHAYFIFLALFGLLFLITAVGCYFNIRKRRRQIAARERRREKRKQMKQDKKVLVEEDELDVQSASTAAESEDTPPYTPSSPATLPQNDVRLEIVKENES